MVKFGKELEAQLVQEWRSAYVDYWELKREIAAVRQALANSPSAKPPGSKNFTRQITRSVTKVQDSLVYATGRAADFLKSRPSRISRINSSNEELLKVERIDPSEEGQYEEYTTELSDVLQGSLGVKIEVFFARLDGEFNKVNHFFRNKEKEFISQFETLKQQVEALEEIRIILKQGGSYHTAAATETDSDTPSTISEAIQRATQRLASRPEGKVEMNVLGSAGGKSDSSLQGGDSHKPQMRLKIPLTSPGTTIKSVTQSLWEDLLKQGGADNFSSDSAGEANITVTKNNVRVAERMLKAAFEEFYRGLGLLKSYCSLNVIAFGKILKKFDKVSGNRTLPIYIKAVELSHFSTSNTTIILLENVEELYAKNFRRMTALKPETTSDL